MLTPEIGRTTIAHYRLERLLARGGMSVVYLAYDVHTNKQVAIKLVHKNEHNYYERFQREAHTLASLKHDHILPALDYGEYDSWFYMVMPYIEYGSLRDRLARGIFTTQETEKILIQLVAAIQYAHKQGIIHRDIKPSNILLRDGTHVYLADFGLVRHVEEMGDITQTGCLLGTPEYMAPELIERPATQISDIYALGIVLYYMLTGTVPFKGSTPIGTCWKHQHERPVAPSTRNSTLSHATDQVILHALAKQPEQRIQSANDLLQAYQASIRYEQKAIVNVVEKSHVITIPSVITRRRPSVVFRVNKKFLHHAICNTVKMRVGALLIVAALLLFIIPTFLGFSLSHGNGRSQVSMALNANAPFVHSRTLTTTPTTHPTPTGSKTQTATPTIHSTSIGSKTSTQHSTPTTSKPLATTPSSNTNGNKNTGTHGSKGSDKSKKHQHKHQH